MKTLQGNELKGYVDAGLTSITEARFLLKDLHNYMVSDNDRKVCCLYGLRRTGKTVMALQEARALNDYDNTLFVKCDNGDTTWDLRKTIDEALKINPQIKYIFVDEATKAERFINTCSFLADDYAMMGKKVVLAGTDSLSFFISETRELFGRAHFLHTTYIPFKEYNAVLGKDIDDYIRYGGTLTDGKNNVFYNKDVANKYTNAAIVENIANSLGQWNNGRNSYYPLLAEIVENREFSSIVNKVLEYHNHKFLARIINNKFNANDLGSTADMVFSSIPDASLVLRSDAVKERVRVALGIKENLLSQIDDDVVMAIIESLENLDVLSALPNDDRLNNVKTKTRDVDPAGNYNEEYIFTQAGMRYAQIKPQMDALTTSSEFKTSFSAEQQTMILKKLESGILGGMLEDIVIYQLAMDIKSYGQQGSRKVTKYSAQRGEFDAVVIDCPTDSAFVIEVKHSDKMADDQRQHLTSEEVCSRFESVSGVAIVNKAVVYRGENGESEDGVLYINASDFLIRSQEITNALLAHCGIRTFEQLESVMAGGGEQKVKPSKKRSSDIER